MKRVIQRLIHWGTTYEPLITVTVSKNAILHNLGQFQSLIGEKKIAPVLKSNAYGHSLEQMAELLDPLHFPFFAVDSYYEALTLRRDGIKTPILIIGYTYPDTVVSNSLASISFAVTSHDLLTELIDKVSFEKRSPLKIHLKIDTGMRRLGIMLEEVPGIINILKNNRQIILEGIYTHLSDADGEKKDFTHEQIEVWNKITEQFRKEFSETLKYFHASASAGHIFSEKIDSNVFRLGIGLYGLTTSKEISEKISLRPALELVSVISGIEKIKKGDKVGYNGTYTAPNDMTIATIPVGYNEGLDRRLSNEGFVKISAGAGASHHFCPIIGRVSMNITTIDVTEVPHLKSKDKVVIFSSHKTDKNSIEETARICGTIPYDILVHIPQHLRRTLI
ncbi:MAG: alanine racemase [Candidatus Taylorbacteria bacterium]|nr:alanine racemase [Candidatus Taylorbacteria bacterium]